MKVFPVIPQHKTKVVKVRGDRLCFSSGRHILKGEEALAVNILPSSPTGHLYNLKYPMMAWFCGLCSICNSEWAKNND